MVSRNKLTMCRLCLSENVCFNNIFEFNDWQGYVAAEAISDLLKFQVSETDVYPHVVCYKCLNKLTDFRQFKECCQKSKVKYDDMFVPRENLEEHEAEVVDSKTVKSEALYCSDNGHNDYKAVIKQEEVDISGDEYEETFEGTNIEVQHAHAEAVTHHQHPQFLEHERPRCTPKESIDAESCARNISTDGESGFEKLKNISCIVEIEVSSNGTMKRLEEHSIPQGESMYVQGGVGIWKEEGKGGETGTGGEGECKRGSAEKGVESERKSFKCSYCGKVLMSKSNLITHMITHGFGKPYKCEVCGKVFQSKGNLESHVLTHTSSKPYKCTKCCKGFRQSGNLKVHMRTHTGYKPYACVKCSKSFSQSSNLKVHMRSHTGSKPFKCTECSKCFITNSNLKVHIRSHTGYKPYKCTECSKGFITNDFLNIHMRTHTGYKPYQCSACTKSFSTSSHLKRHTRTHRL